MSVLARQEAANYSLVISEEKKENSRLQLLYKMQSGGSCLSLQPLLLLLPRNASHQQPSALCVVQNALNHSFGPSVHLQSHLLHHKKCLGILAFVVCFFVLVLCLPCLYVNTFEFLINKGEQKLLTKSVCGAEGARHFVTVLCFSFIRNILVH